MLIFPSCLLLKKVKTLISNWSLLLYWNVCPKIITTPFYFHLLIAQVVLGMLLEIVNGWWRVGLIYFGGVLTGSLLTSVVDPRVYLVGASGGVYALIGAHVPTIILNWKSMTSWLEKGVKWVQSFILNVELRGAAYNNNRGNKERHVFIVWKDLLFFTRFVVIKIFVKVDEDIGRNDLRDRLGCSSDDGNFVQRSRSTWSWGSSRSRRKRLNGRSTTRSIFEPLNASSSFIAYAWRTLEREFLKLR